ncbi:MAG: Flp pilus assembly complex ATPase component TadA [Patescibacteria group bacterium]|nr:Flp pilus assembly complex ATPase component TadA [Patescibacteria group bacterium]MDE2015366.1 Flp pilus assembly complex ATPase component TadA [Patescibacteria group bacterium]MDE2227019.1 Flp pilus assembly complex ATPase component TadA [Patescibacteria group bacterium]
MHIPLPEPQLKRILIDDKLITSERFDALLDEAERKNQSILDVLVAQGIVDANYLGNLVADALGVGRVDFSNIAIDKELVQLIPEQTSRQRQAILFRREPDGIIDVAMTDPSDLETIEFLTQRLKTKIKPFLATTDDLNRGFSVYGYELGQDFKKLIEDNIRQSLSVRSKTIEEAAAELPIVGIVDNLLSYAIASRASDIHIEILEDSMLVRYRIDGILYEVLNVTKVIHSAIVARIKLLSGLKIDEHMRPQDGRFRHQIVNQVVDVRVSAIPTYYGEKVEMRLLDATQKPLSLEELGMNETISKIVNNNTKSAYGMILSCGPTGSGKTTTLYAIMNILNKPEVNITTIEDPIEYNMRYVNQTQINPQAGVTFASGLRALLRQDPNIIMVGEIRDAETAGISVQAALTGHLLMSSLHTNDAPTAIPRLFDLNIPPFLVSSVLNLVIAQRLVRKICQTCVYSFEAASDIRKVIADQLKDVGAERAEAEMPKIFYRGKGCDDCGKTGYKGRLGIFEALEINDKIKKLIGTGSFELEALRSEIRREGMKTMFEDGLEKAELAVTTIEEVLRVIRE